MSEYEKVEQEHDALTKLVYAAVRAKKSGSMAASAELLALVDQIAEDADRDLEALYNEKIAARYPEEQAREAA